MSNTMTMTIQETGTKKIETTKTLTERLIERKVICNNAFQEMQYLISKGRTEGDVLNIVTRKYRLYDVEIGNLMQRQLSAQKLTYALCEVIGNRLCSKWNVRPRVSTGIADETTYGYGPLDPNGYWQFPVFVEVAEKRLRREASISRREAVIRIRNENRRFEREVRSLLKDQSGKVGETLGSFGLSQIKVA